MLVRDLAKKLNKSNQEILSALGDATKKQASKLTDEEIVAITAKLSSATVEKVVVQETVKQAVVAREFKSDDPIRCRSMTAGELILVGRSGIHYSWKGVGDVMDVRYDDILALKYARSQFLLNPLFVIEDEELLNDSKFADLKELYDKIYTADIEEILNLPNEQFVEVLTKAPIGLKNAVKLTVATMVENDTFDSLQKIQAVEQICGAEILNLK